MEATQKFSVDNLADLESFLTANNYLSGSSFPGAEDARMFYALKDVPIQDIYPNIFHWYVLIAGFKDDVIKSWTDTKTQGGKEPKEESKKRQESNPIETVDKSGNSTKDLQATTSQPPKKKPAPVPKTSVVFEVKVIDTEQDLDELAKKILNIEMDGLLWKQEYKFVDIGFGIRNLQMGCVVEDKKIPSTDDIFDTIREWEDEVQSVDVICLQNA